MRRQVYVDIGSNIDRDKHICEAIIALKRDFPDVVLSQPVESEAEGFDGPDFINLCAGFETTLSYEDLKAYLVGLEKRQLRVRGEKKYDSRTLDIDILLFGDEVLKPSVDVPRAEILKFPFVLYPLAEIAGECVHPELGITINEVVEQQALDKDGIRPASLSCLVDGEPS